jgi:hypothetical protein
MLLVGIIHRSFEKFSVVGSSGVGMPCCVNSSVSYPGEVPDSTIEGGLYREALGDDILRFASHEEKGKLYG